jgi:hypothetical protein
MKETITYSIIYLSQSDLSFLDKKQKLEFMLKLENPKLNGSATLQQV